MMGTHRYLWGSLLTLSLILGGLALTRHFLFDPDEMPTPPRHSVPKAQAPVLEALLPAPPLTIAPSKTPPTPLVSDREVNEVPPTQPPEEQPLPTSPRPEPKVQSPRRTEEPPPEDEPVEWTEDAPEEAAETPEQPAGPTEPPDLLENGF